MKLDRTKDYRGTMVYMTCPLQPLPAARKAEPTVLHMQIDLLKAKIAAATDDYYNPANLEYERRQRKSAQYRRH